jgi:hypothetical protein
MPKPAYRTQHIVSAYVLQTSGTCRASRSSSRSRWPCQTADPSRRLQTRTCSHAGACWRWDASQSSSQGPSAPGVCSHSYAPLCPGHRATAGMHRQGVETLNPVPMGTHPRTVSATLLPASATSSIMPKPCAHPPANRSPRAGIVSRQHCKAGTSGRRLSTVVRRSASGAPHVDGDFGGVGSKAGEVK